ncbi:MAG: hypothetical protein ABSD85_10750 [Acidimicrobiales bacterium]
MSRRVYRVWHNENTWDPARDTELVIEDDLSLAEWIAPLLVPRSFEVRMMVPQGFNAYARIFFPFVTEHDEHVTWAEMARRNGTVAHALVEKGSITLEPEREYQEWTTFSGFAPEQSDALLAVLARHTVCDTACYLLWDGWGDLNERAFEHKPKLHHSWRDYYLLGGPLSALDDFHEQPNYRWPYDRAWCVVTDTDFEWAYVAGSAACIEELLAVPVIDAFATLPENPAHSGMDRINDPDGTEPPS